jgi:hypothetical protein
MRTLLTALAALGEAALDLIIWLHDRLMLFVLIVFLVPLLVVVVISLLIYDIRPWARSIAAAVGYSALLAIPLWLGFCAILERSTTPTATCLKQAMHRAPIVIGYALFAVGGLMWLLGAI